MSSHIRWLVSNEHSGWNVKCWLMVCCIISFTLECEAFATRSSSSMRGKNESTEKAIQMEDLHFRFDKSGATIGQIRNRKQIWADERKCKQNEKNKRRGTDQSVRDRFKTFDSQVFEHFVVEQLSGAGLVRQSAACKRERKTVSIKMNCREWVSEWVGEGRKEGARGSGTDKGRPNGLARKDKLKWASRMQMARPPKVIGRPRARHVPQRKTGCRCDSKSNRCISIWKETATKCRKRESERATPPVPLAEFGHESKAEEGKNESNRKTRCKVCSAGYQKRPQTPNQNHQKCSKCLAKMKIDLTKVHKSHVHNEREEKNQKNNAIYIFAFDFFAQIEMEREMKMKIKMKIKKMMVCKCKIIWHLLKYMRRPALAKD